MPARTTVCPACNGTVPRGSLSCPACGALLASVAGGSVRPADEGVDAAPEASTVSGVADDDPSAMSPARIQTQALPEVDPNDARASGLPTADLGPATPMAPSSIRQTEIEGAGSMALPPFSASAADGGYLPPGTPFVAAAVPGSAPPAPTPAASPPVAVAAAPLSAPTGPTATLDLARLGQVLGYATAAGSGLIAFGLLMPWSRSVIGASGVSGYFDTWGLAGSGHILVFLGSFVVLTISVLPTRIPLSIRTGLAGLLLGGFSLGLVWPYLIGPLGAGIGVLVVTVGALVLTVAGIASIWRDRHAATDRSV